MQRVVLLGRKTSGKSTLSARSGEFTGVRSCLIVNSTRALRSPSRTRLMVPMSSSSGCSISTNNAVNSPKQRRISKAMVITRNHCESWMCCSPRTNRIVAMPRISTAMIGMKTFHCQRMPVAQRANWAASCLYHIKEPLGKQVSLWCQLSMRCARQNSSQGKQDLLGEADCSHRIEEDCDLIRPGGNRVQSHDFIEQVFNCPTLSETYM
jgi:hypothetical protein